jgi:uncharacterized membrane protein
MKLLSLLPLADWAALLFLIGAWTAYALFASSTSENRPSLLQVTNRYRARWLLQAISREQRVLDGLITQNLSSSPSFFASTTIIIIGGLFALLGTAERAAALVQEIPIAETSSAEVFQLKILVLIGIFVFAFFRFTWSLRQYTFVALVIGSMPDHKLCEADPAAAQAFADKAARMVGLAAETFNNGLRAYYFAFAAVAWFFSALACAFGVAFVIAVLYRREFRSEVLEVLAD